MNIYEAAKKNNLIKRKKYEDWINIDYHFGLEKDDLLADDWIYKDEWKEITEGTQEEEIGCFDIGLTKKVLRFLELGSKLKYKKINIHFSDDNLETLVWLENNKIKLSNHEIFDNYFPNKIILEQLLRGYGKWYIKVDYND